MLGEVDARNDGEYRDRDEQCAVPCARAGGRDRQQQAEVERRMAGRERTAARVPDVRPVAVGEYLVRPQAAGVKQEPPLPVTVELARGAASDPALAQAICDRLRNVLVVQARVELVPWGSLPRTDYKSRLVEQ